jgi:TolA-binding protein
MSAIVNCPDDLLVRARQPAGGLSLVEQQRLTTHLSGCGLCRMAASLGDSVGRSGAPDVGDVAMAERLIARLLSPATVGERRPPARARALSGARGFRSRRRRLVDGRLAVAAALLLLIGGAASAAWWRYAPLWRRPSPQLQEPQPASPAGPRKRHAAIHAVPAPEPEMEPEQPEQPEPEPEPEATPAPPATVTPPAAAAVRVRSGAAQLFRQANQERREGRFDRALASYRTLQRAQPRTQEATLSFLSMGELYLERDRPEAALAAYDSYLKTGDAALAEEALVGKASALERLGRGGAERAVWVTLLARHPQSDYRWRAQQRLDQLGATVRPHGMGGAR